MQTLSIVGRDYSTEEAYSIGIPKDSVLTYETQIKAGKFVVIAHGTRDEVAKSKEILLGAEHHDGKTQNCCA